ncbi:hypothetical protein [Dickeya oryzae]
MSFTWLAHVSRVFLRAMTLTIPAMGFSPTQQGNGLREVISGESGGSQ